MIARPRLLACQFTVVVVAVPTFPEFAGYREFILSCSGCSHLRTAAPSWWRLHERKRGMLGRQSLGACEVPRQQREPVQDADLSNLDLIG